MWSRMFCAMPSGAPTSVRVSVASALQLRNEARVTIMNILFCIPPFQCTLAIYQRPRSDLR